MAAGFPLETIVLDPAAPANLPRQIYGQLRALIEGRSLPSGSTLPSTRLLAKDLGLGRNTVIAAYDQLALEGYLRMRKCAPPLVVDLPARAVRTGMPPTAPAGRISERGQIMLSQPHHSGRPGHLALHPGMPDALNFPFNTWSKLLTRRAKHAGHDLFGVYHVTGYPALREAIARYLAASRGVACNPEQIVITNGAQSAFDLLARIFIDPGDSVWMEEPGYYGASAAFLSAGAKLMPLVVNDDGWQLDPPTTRPRLAFVTPSCHHPLGLTMAMEQRLTLLRLAEDGNFWVIEDDYDSEYRFQGQPIPALQGIGGANRVVYVGTFAKMLFPAMRLGFMVVPEAIRDGLAAALSTTGQFAPLLTQAALADFINDGHLTRHLRRMRRLYAARRGHFMEVFDRYLGEWMRLRRTETGIQLVGLFHRNIDDRPLAAAAAARGVNVSALSMQYRHGRPRRGLVMGFAAVDERATLNAIERLRAVFKESS
ncbi:MAG: PLP-dependent aminotransferase family protein [Rhizobiales bacterium]|nr:PLP-dependent aminotransferase family protein [Hyphomicrobiales bacterium]MBI3674673.1 PLP-dependent aminotransferase family protein [Hyphomicrobiales bacterium]